MSVVKLASKTQIKQYHQALPSAHSSLDYLVLFTQEHNSTCTLWPGCIPWAIPLATGTTLLRRIFQPVETAEPTVLRKVNLKVQLPAEKEEEQEGTAQRR